MIPLSVLDITWPGHVPRLVQQLDANGYLRFWATEHHSLQQSASPIVTATLAATLTGRLRIGTAGVLLNYACPVKVAEDFRLLELYFPGRIDLGVAGARASLHEALYLDGRPPISAASYAERVKTLVELVRGEHEVQVGPRSAHQSALWLCGTSRASAELAGSLGMHYAFHRYIVGSSDAARDAIAAYRDAFRTTTGAAPYAMIACYGACAASDAEAARQWKLADAGNACFTGSPQACVDQLFGLAGACDADEIAINLLGETIDVRLAGYAMLAETAGLTRPRETRGGGGIPRRGYGAPDSAAMPA